MYALEKHTAGRHFQKNVSKKNTDQVNTYLGINSDDFATLIAIIGKYIFIAFDTVRMIVS